MEKYQRLPYFGTLKETGREEERKTAGEERKTEKQLEKRGRPKNSWRRSVIKEAGRSWNELRLLAADRQKWKGLIDHLCS